MKNYQNYKRGYFMPPVECTDWVKKEYISKAPAWCRGMQQRYCAFVQFYIICAEAAGVQKVKRGDSQDCCRRC